jgi:hypothetical protein
MNPIEVDIPDDDDDLVMNREESNIRGDDPEPTSGLFIIIEFNLGGPKVWPHKTT